MAVVRVCAWFVFLGRGALWLAGLLKASEGGLGAELLPWALGGDALNKPPIINMLAHTCTLTYTSTIYLHMSISMGGNPGEKPAPRSRMAQKPPQLPAFLPYALFPFPK